MAQAKQILNISAESERAILTFAEKGHQLLMNQFAIRSNLEMVDRYYAMEGDWGRENVRARLANRVGDKTKFQDVTVPIVMPQVRAALGYMANVFLTGYPIFGVSGDTTAEDAALQMETIIAENAVTAGWARQLMLFFLDGLKYNLHGIELEWQQRNTATIDTDNSYPNGAKPKTTVWKGNVLRRMDMYNTFYDPRVHPSEIASEGEYAGYIEMYSRVRMKKMINDLYGEIPPATCIRAFESGPAPGGMTGSGSPFAYYVPLINPFPIMERQNTQTFDWMAWASATIAGPKSGIKYNNVFEVMTLYARILPSDFGLRVPAENTPQVWKFKIVNGQVVLFAERQSNVHNLIPILFGQPLEDGLDFQTKSFAQNVCSLQDIASAMWNGYMASKRRLVGDRVLYDPLRIRQKDIESTNPVAKIPVRPSAFGKAVNEAVYQFPFRDDATQSLLDGASRVSAFADKVNGQNPAMAGQFVKGNKTKQEYDDVMGHGNTGNQLMAIMTENQVFIPLKEAIKLNILQFQPEATLYNRDKNQQVKIKPQDLRQAAVHFKVSDGLIPTEEQMDTDEFQTALQTIGSSQALQQGYDLPKLFSYLMKMRGADLTPFETDQQAAQIQGQVQAALGIVAQAIDKGYPPPTGDQLNSWAAFTVWFGKTQQQLTQAATQQAQQAEQQAAQQAKGATQQQSPDATALQTTQG